MCGYVPKVYQLAVGLLQCTCGPLHTIENSMFLHPLHISCPQSPVSTYAPPPMVPIWYMRKILLFFFTRDGGPLPSVRNAPKHLAGKLPDDKVYNNVLPSVHRAAGGNDVFLNKCFLNLASRYFLLPAHTVHNVFCATMFVSLHRTVYHVYHCQPH